MLYLFDRMQLGERWQVLAGLRRGDYRTEDLRVAANGTGTVTRGFTGGTLIDCHWQHAHTVPVGSRQPQ